MRRRIGKDHQEVKCGDKDEYHKEPAFGGDNRMKMNEYHECMRSLPSAGTINEEAITTAST